MDPAGYRSPDAARATERAELEAAIRASAELDEGRVMDALQRRPGKRIVRVLLGVATLLVAPVIGAVIGGAISNDGSFMSGFGGAVIGFFAGLVVGVIALARLALST